MNNKYTTLKLQDTFEEMPTTKNSSFNSQFQKPTELQYNTHTLIWLDVGKVSRSFMQESEYVFSSFYFYKSHHSKQIVLEKKECFFVYPRSKWLNLYSKLYGLQDPVWAAACTCLHVRLYVRPHVSISVYILFSRLSYVRTTGRTEYIFRYKTGKGYKSGQKLLTCLLVR